jgi:branched-chain amino acid transport system substrate-binding protein
MADVLHNQIAATPFGEIKFDEHGDAIGVGYTMYTVKEGKFEQVK